MLSVQRFSCLLLSNLAWMGPFDYPDAREAKDFFSCLSVLSWFLPWCWCSSFILENIWSFHINDFSFLQILMWESVRGKRVLPAVSRNPLFQFWDAETMGFIPLPFSTSKSNLVTQLGFKLVSCDMQLPHIQQRTTFAVEPKPRCCVKVRFFFWSLRQQT